MKFAVYECEMMKERALASFTFTTHIAGVEIWPSSGVEIRTTSLHTVSINSRFSSYVAPWAGPCSSSALSLQTVGRQALRGPASKEVKRGETFPSPESPMADEGGSTKLHP